MGEAAIGSSGPAGNSGLCRNCRGDDRTPAGLCGLGAGFHEGAIDDLDDAFGARLVAHQRDRRGDSGFGARPGFGPEDTEVASRGVPFDYHPGVATGTGGEAGVSAEVFLCELKSPR